MARTRLYWAITVVAGIPVACVSFGVLMLLSVPLAHVVAGKHTDFSFSVSFSLNAVLAATSTISAAGLAVQTQRVRHHKGRARLLEDRAKVANDNPGGNQG
jgi:hypothetical protein